MSQPETSTMEPPSGMLPSPQLALPPISDAALLALARVLGAIASVRPASQLAAQGESHAA